MRHIKEKQQIVKDNPELQLCENGDFKIKAELVEKYEIIDMHCHLFQGLSQLFPSILQKEKWDQNASLMDMSCFPFSIELFDLDHISFYKMSYKVTDAGWDQSKDKAFFRCIGFKLCYGRKNYDGYGCKSYPEISCATDQSGK